MVNKVNFGTCKEVNEVVKVSLNLWELNNVKQKGIKRLNPHGNKLDAVRHLRSKLEEIGNPFNIIIKIFDDVYICDLCNKISEKESENEECAKFCTSCSMAPMEHVGPSVVITSKDSLVTLRELMAGQSLDTEACCLDHQPSRLREYTTFAGYAYDLDLRRMAPLFAAVMTNERELSVYHCLDVIDRCMIDELGFDKGFDPNMIIADEASAIKNAVARKLGKEKIMKQYGTCQLHFKGSVLQHCSFAIGNAIEIWQFMKLSLNLMIAESPEIYDLFKKEMLEFISQTEQRYSYLYNWLEFYDQRKTGWANAFRNPELPQSNKGEAGNAHYSAVTHLTALTLDLGVKCMMAEMTVYAGCKREITTGQYKGGNGPTRVKMNEKLLKETFQRIENTPLTSEAASALVRDVLEKIGLKGNIEEENLQPSKQRSELATHKYLADQINARTEARVDSPKFVNTPHKAPKKGIKRKMKFSDNLEDLENVNNKKRKQNVPTKPESLNDKILKTLTEGITFKTVEIGVYKITVKNDPTRCYTIDVRKHPTCTCPEFLRIQTDREKERSNAVCKHISVMCLCLGFKPSSEIVRRYTYNATERIYLDLKISTFSHQNVDIEKIKSTFEN